MVVTCHECKKEPARAPKKLLCEGCLAKSDERYAQQARDRYHKDKDRYKDKREKYTKKVKEKNEFLMTADPDEVLAVINADEIEALETPLMNILRVKREKNHRSQGDHDYVAPRAWIPEVAQFDRIKKAIKERYKSKKDPDVNHVHVGRKPGS